MTFDLSGHEGEEIKINIYNQARDVIKVLTNRDIQGSSLIWKGTNEAKEPVAAGVYLAILLVDNEEVAARKLVIIR